MNDIYIVRSDFDLEKLYEVFAAAHARHDHKAIDLVCGDGDWSSRLAAYDRQKHLRTVAARFRDELLVILDGGTWGRKNIAHEMRRMRAKNRKAVPA